jgi:hypothetical protein
MRHVVIILIIAMLTLCYCIMSHATLIVFYDYITPYYHVKIKD